MHYTTGLYMLHTHIVMSSKILVATTAAFSILTVYVLFESEFMILPKPSSLNRPAFQNWKESKSPRTVVHMKHYICPHFNGRLGNQLFQFASAFGIAKYKGMDVVIDSKCYLLEAFNLSVNYTNDYSICSPPKVKVIKERQTSAFDRRMVYFDITSNVFLTRHLASYLYFEKYENELRKQLTFKETIRSEAATLLDNYLRQYGIFRSNRTEKSYSKHEYFKRNSKTKITLIGVHIRRGDWVTRKGRMVATREYLQKSVDLYKSMYSNLVFVVASNGLDWCKENMPQNINVIYLVGNSVWLDLATVTLCEHFISTVGTFSWWAAWLTGGNVTYFKWPAKEGSRFRRAFSKDYKDYFYPKWIGF